MSSSASTPPQFEQLAENLYCIDALYTAPSIACCYLLGDGEEFAMIETGTARSVDNILATLASVGIAREQLRYVIPTHVHLDHAGAAGQLMQHFPRAELLIHPRGARHMIDPDRLVASSVMVYGAELFDTLYGNILPIDESRVRQLEDHSSLRVGKRALQVRHTRGHADHHFCLYDEDTEGWFSGDMFGVSYQRQRFNAGAFVMPATTPTQFDPTLYAESIDLLVDAKPRAFYLTHYGELAFEREQAEMLKRQLHAYHDLGASGVGEAGELESQVMEITRNELAKLVADDIVAREASALAMDARLNAQGIAHWTRTRSA